MAPDEGTERFTIMIPLLVSSEQSLPSPEPSPGPIRAEIMKNGCVWYPDEEIGTALDTVGECTDSIETLKGLEMIETYAWNDKRVRSALHAFFPTISLVGAIVLLPNPANFAIGPEENSLYCTYSGTPHTIAAINVQLWQSQSRITLHHRSQDVSGSGLLLDKKGGREEQRVLLKEIPERVWTREIESVTDFMAIGGLLITDARLAFTIQSGKCVNLLFIDHESAANFRTMKWPKDAELMKKLRKMDNLCIRVHFEDSGFIES